MKTKSMGVWALKWQEFGQMAYSNLFCNRIMDSLLSFGTMLMKDLKIFLLLVLGPQDQQYSFDQVQIALKGWWTT